MMSTTETTKTTEVREVTLKELVSAFDRKYVNITPLDHYGISINMRKATLEMEEDEHTELYFVSRDDENRVTASICIDENSIENIEKCGDGTYTIHFSFCITSIDISECKTEDDELLLVGDLESEKGDMIRIEKDESICEMYIDETSSDLTTVDEDGLTEVSSIGFISEDQSFPVWRSN